MNYRDAVEILASTNDTRRFDNKGHQHAAAVLEMMFKYNNEIRMYSGTLNSDVTDDQNFMQALSLFLKAGKNLYVFLDNLPNEEERSNALKKVLSYSEKGNAIVKIATDSFVNELRGVFGGNVYHFSLGDNKAYRVEIDAENYKATCSYNKPEKVEILKQIFDKNFF